MGINNKIHYGDIGSLILKDYKLLHCNAGYAWCEKIHNFRRVTKWRQDYIVSHKDIVKHIRKIYK